MIIIKIVIGLIIFFWIILALAPLAAAMEQHED